MTLTSTESAVAYSVNTTIAPPTTVKATEINLIHDGFMVYTFKIREQVVAIFPFTLVQSIILENT